MQLGDWVQAAESLDDGEGRRVAQGAIGHVLEGSVDGDPGVVNVFFERSGVVTICHITELTWLGTSEIGRSPDLNRP